MFTFFESTLKNLSIHRVGNKLQDEYYVLSEAQKELSDLESQYLLNYFLSPFEKVNEVYSLYHPSGVNHMNVVFDSTEDMFAANELFHHHSQKLAIHLFETSNHPKIKGGEFYVAYFKDVQFQGDLFDAIGIFKSENKETFFTVHPNRSGFDIQFEQDGVSIQKLDKGCLILNSERDKGFRVLTIDTKSSNDASYWKDEFLQLKVINDEYQMTSGLLGIAKDFIINRLDEDFEISKTDKADLLNKSIKYFKEKESFDIDEFTSEVFQNKEASSTFKKFKSIYDEDFDVVTPDHFDISTAAVKKRQSQFKPIIKLDKNFHIYVHGNKDLIEKGFDADRSMNYYKVYFKDEE